MNTLKLASKFGRHTTNCSGGAKTALLIADYSYVFRKRQKIAPHLIYQYISYAILY